MRSSHTTTRVSGARYGSGLRRTPRTTEKIAVFAPMPSASVTSATTVNTGVAINERYACLRSWITKASSGSLGSKRLQGVEARGAARGNRTREDSGHSENQADRAEDERLRAADAEQELSEKGRGEDRHNPAREEPGDGQAPGAPHLQ